MKIYISQIYIEPGVNFSFSHVFQQWLGTQLSVLTEMTTQLSKEFPLDSELMFRISAKRGINRPEILGPTVYRKTREVEFTIFLPFKILVIDNLPGYKELLDALLESIVGVLQGAGVNTKEIERNKAELIRIILSDRNMFEFE